MNPTFVRRAAAAAGKKSEEHLLKKGAKRDPELYVRLKIEAIPKPRHSFPMKPIAQLLTYLLSRSLALSWQELLVLQVSTSVLVPQFTAESGPIDN